MVAMDIGSFLTLNYNFYFAEHYYNPGSVRRKNFFLNIALVRHGLQDKLRTNFDIWVCDTQVCSKGLSNCNICSCTCKFEDTLT